jgi:hypothetical protein
MVVRPSSDRNMFAVAVYVVLSSKNNLQYVSVVRPSSGRNMFAVAV